MRQCSIRHNLMNVVCNVEQYPVYFISSDAGWSSLAARRAHNPKVVGSNPAPATKSHIPARTKNPSKQGAERSISAAPIVLQSSERPGTSASLKNIQQIFAEKLDASH